MKKTNLLFLCTLAMINNLHTMQRKPITWAERNADDFVDRAGCTQLHIAADSGDIKKLLSLILKYPRMVHARDNTLRTALHLAAQNGHHHIAEKLLMSGADKDAQDTRGFTPLHLAKNREVSTVLSRFKANHSLRAFGCITAKQMAPKPFFRKKFRCCLQPFKDFCFNFFEKISNTFDMFLRLQQRPKYLQNPSVDIQLEER